MSRLLRTGKLSVRTSAPLFHAKWAPALMARPQVLAERHYSEAPKPDNAGTKSEGAAEQAESAAATEPEAGEPSEVDQLQAKYEAKDKEAAKFKDLYARSIADFRNLQKTTEQDIKNAKTYALQKFAKELLDSIDNFDLALGAVKAESLSTNEELKGFYDGVQMVQSVFEKTLAKHGLVKTDPLGETFNPQEHEAILQAPQPGKEPGTIFTVQRVGFKYNNRVIRAPKVGIVAETN